ncbi:MAG TPA: RNA-binding protein, partial [Candidatus Aenigmarchaeota archaeon]|nr:RNA-binding protein [Candidatus Aenigmarchaeota archaeon]
MKEEKKVREIVIPGQFLGEGKSLHGTYFENGKVFSKFLGIVKQRGNGFMVIPLAGKYRPKIGDKVIGIIQ